MSLHKMAPVDAAWFHMDGSANLAMVTSVALTSQPLDFEKVKALYAHRLQAYPRFRQRVVEHGLTIPAPHWEDMPNFDIGQHLHHVALPAPSDRRALTDLLSDICSSPLDPLQPLWQVHVIDGVDGGSALVTRFHHCIGDGTAMVALSMRLYDTEADAPIQRPEYEMPNFDDEGSGGWVETIVGALARSSAAVVSVADAAMNAVTNPLPLIEKVAAVASGTGMLLGELLKKNDPESPFKGSFTLAKRVAWSAPVAIADVKAIGALAGAKVNDVLIAGMTGALRAYLQERQVDVGQTTLRAMVPVDLRSPNRALELGNDFGLVLLELPVEAETPMERLRLTKAHMDALKRSAEPIAMRLLFEVFGRTPKLISDIPSSMLSNKASIVMTNVMGAPQTLYVTGAPVERLMFWVPHPGEHMGMGVSILSYCGHATLSVVTDAHLVPDPETITAYFEREFVTMLAAARGADRQAKAEKKRPARTAARAQAAAGSATPARKGAPAKQASGVKVSAKKSAKKSAKTIAKKGAGKGATAKKEPARPRSRATPRSS